MRSNGGWRLTDGALAVNQKPQSAVNPTVNNVRVGIGREVAIGPEIGLSVNVTGSASIAVGWWPTCQGVSACPAPDLGAIRPPLTPGDPGAVKPSTLRTR